MQDKVGEFQVLYLEQRDKLKKDLERAKQNIRASTISRLSFTSLENWHRQSKP